MTRVDFYILSGSSPQNRQRFACRLASKAYNLGHPIYIHTGSTQETVLLDDLLWTFSDISFVPHSIYQPGATADVPVLIGHTLDPDICDALLVNLSATVPPHLNRFDRLAEVIGPELPNIEAGRERFRFYREQGYAIETHDIPTRASP